MRTIQAHGYEIHFGRDGEVRVKHGKFEAGLGTLEECGLLLSPSGRSHTVPAWVIHQISVTARETVAEPH